MTYTAAEVVMMVTGVIVVLTPAIVTIITAARQGARLDTLESKQVTRLDTIHTLVNSTAEAARAENKRLVLLAEETAKQHRHDLEILAAQIAALNAALLEKAEQSPAVPGKDGKQ